MFNKKAQENHANQNIIFIIKYFLISIGGFLLFEMAKLAESSDVAIALLVLASIAVMYAFYNFLKKGLSS